MSKRMLIDAAYEDEQRVVVLDGKSLVEADFFSASKAQLKGNVYLARVTRVEPSLQAAFIDFGHGKHGFLPFSEIHPDYFQIPVADREALLEDVQETLDRRHVPSLDPLQSLETPDSTDANPERPHEDHEDTAVEDATEAHTTQAQGEESSLPKVRRPRAKAKTSPKAVEAGDSTEAHEETEAKETPPKRPRGRPRKSAVAAVVEEDVVYADTPSAPLEANDDDIAQEEAAKPSRSRSRRRASAKPSTRANARPSSSDSRPHRRRDDDLDDLSDADFEARTMTRAILSKKYKIQEVIKRNQVVLVQVAKEERGDKGAALTTYLSLPGRYCVLMPNTHRGGGISRRIASAADRKRLKAVLDELDLAPSMSLIVRTAGAERTKQEIKRDFAYLSRTWDEIRETTLSSFAPALIYEEANLIKRAIRDIYESDTQEVLVAGSSAHKAAKAFMKTLTPSHAARVKLYKDDTPIFQAHGVEGLLEELHQPTVHLPSGGYLVFNQTEALVAVDVNSGKATRERNIEETALRTNLEAAAEAARQLRLRDLAGLVVIDFIDMEESRNIAAVERAFKDALKPDRARIQTGRISQFGLLELSRQRLRPSVAEATMVLCPTCHGAGFTKSDTVNARAIVRHVEYALSQGPTEAVTLWAGASLALTLANQERANWLRLEAAYSTAIDIAIDPQLGPTHFRCVFTRDGRYESFGSDADLPNEPKRRGRARPRADTPQGSDADAAKGRKSTRPKKREALQAEIPETPVEGAGDTEAGERAGEEADRRRRRRGKRGGRKRNKREGGEDGQTAATVTATVSQDSAEDSAENTASPVDVSDPDTPQPDLPDLPHPEARPKSRRRPRQAADLQTKAPLEASAPAQPTPLPPPSVESVMSFDAPAEDRPKRRGWWTRMRG